MEGCKKKLKQQISLPIMKGNGYWAKSEQEKADTFAKHLASFLMPER
jgi:hypothetical protein